MPGFLPPPTPPPPPMSEYPGYSEHPWIIHGCLAPYPPCQSIRGFPGYFEHPWIIHGCLASYPPPHVRVSVDSLDTLNIPDGCLASYTRAHVHTGQSICRYSSLITQDILGSLWMTSFKFHQHQCWVSI